MPITPVPSVPLFQVNSHDSPGAGAPASANNSQINSKVIGLTNGNFLVAWQDGTTALTGFEPYDIAGQLYDSNANPIGSEFLVSSYYLDLNQQAVDLAARPGGGFAAAYQTTDAAGFNDGENIMVQVFDSAGNPVRYDEFRQGNAGPHGIDDTSPTITSFSDGRYVVIFEQKDTLAPGSVTELVGYSVDATGVIGAKFSAESVLTNAKGPAAATLSNGNFVVGFEVPGTSAIGFSIRTATGAAVFENDAAATTSGTARVDVAALAGGGFVLAWQDANGDGAGDAGIRIAIYDNAGGLVKASFAATGAGAQIDPAVTALADGGFVVAWRNDASATVQAQTFTAAGVPTGSEGIAALDDVRDPSLGVLTDGRFVVSVDNDSGADFDIEAAIWNALAPPSVTVNQAAGQNDPTNHASILFDVVFSQGVTGFDQNDIVLSGTAGATTAVVTAIDAAHYRVAVSGFAQDGTVVASIPAHAAQAGAQFSIASTSTDNIVLRDTTAPRLTGVAATPSAGVEKPGAIVDFTLAFDEAVNLAGGTPTLALNDGGVASFNPAATGSLGDPAKLVFSYLVSPGDAPTSALAINGFNANGATIADIAGNAATLALVTQTFSGLSVDTSKPVVSVDPGKPPLSDYNGPPALNPEFYGLFGLSI